MRKLMELDVDRKEAAEQLAAKTHELQKMVAEYIEKKVKI